MTLVVLNSENPCFQHTIMNNSQSETTTLQSINSIDRLINWVSSQITVTQKEGVWW